MLPPTAAGHPWVTDRPATFCGTFVLAGRPNVGKSTLLNRLVGHKLAITSAKPQSTRQAVTGIRTDRDTQLIFIDPPGLLEPQYLLQRVMNEQALRHLERADGILYLHPLGEGPPPPLVALLPETIHITQPILTVFTKADLAATADPGRVDWTGTGSPGSQCESLSVSDRPGAEFEPLLTWCRSHSPAGPFRHPREDISTQSVRFFAAEFVRQAAFEVLGEELPYAVATEVEEFRESRDPVYIRVFVYVERDSQKGMVIGSGGRTIRTLGELARADIEVLLERRVFLDLWVKVLPKWRTSPHVLRQLGFAIAEGRSR